MAKKSSKVSKKASFFRKPLGKLKRAFQKLKTKIAHFRSQHLHFHKSFRRSYREDYQRETNTPGLLNHAFITFQTLFKYWRTFIPFLLLMVCGYIFLVGLMNEETYQQFNKTIDLTNTETGTTDLGSFARAGLLLITTITTGGLDSGMTDVEMVFMVILFLIMWLVTIFLLRHFLAGEKPKLRDGLYNALTPLLSTFVLFAVIFVQIIPIMLVIITYSAAVTTDFLSTPFYALVYFIFAALMILLSLYLLSSSLIALVAVTAPGMYPFRALFAASDMMAERRTKFIIRILYLFFVIALIFVVTILPVILLDLWLKSFATALIGLPIVPFAILVVTCFVFMYATTYLYLYYRWLLDYKEQ